MLHILVNMASCIGVLYITTWMMIKNGYLMPMFLFHSKYKMKNMDIMNFKKLYRFGMQIEGDIKLDIQEWL